MSDTTTPNYHFDLPTVGASQDTWGGKLNANWVAADSAIHNLASGYLPIAGGGTINGNLVIAPPSGNASLSLIKPAATAANEIVGYTTGNARWVILPGTPEAESGANAGSNFSIQRFDDSGNYLGTPLSIGRATGNVSIAQALYLGGLLTASGAVSVAGALSAGSVESQNGYFYVANNTNYYLGRNGSDHIWRFVENGTVNLSLDASGNLAVLGRLTSNDIMNNSGAFYVSGGSNDYFARSTSDGAWRWVENNVVSLTLDAAGNLTARGAVHGSNVTAMEARLEELAARVADLEALRLA